MNDGTDAAILAGVLEDDCARTILVAAREDALSVSELADACGVSEPTVYRRLETLRERDLIEERTRLDADGHHHGVFRASVERVTFRVGDDGVDVEIARRSSMADRFTDVVEGL